MENQHRHITGYRELSEAEIALMNEGKALAEQCGAFCEKLMKAEFAKTSDQEPDKRWCAIGRTHLQEGFMALIRSIAKPTTF
jgi:hypothetical protein